VPERFRILSAPARTILSRTCGFIAEAGFTHSLTPARNCTFACTYCYVPTMRLQGGLQPEDWRRWGQFTTFKENSASLLAAALRSTQRIYCSPTVDPYQPAEALDPHMPALLEALIARPPAVFALQTRAPLILRDLPLLTALARITTLRVSFSLTTNRDHIRRLYEPHCDPWETRLDAIRQLRDSGIRVHATLAPILPCDPEPFAEAAIEATFEALIADPFHTRATKPHGATTRPEGEAISRMHGYTQWHDPTHQNAILERIARIAAAANRPFAAGAAGFAWLAQSKPAKQLGVPGSLF